MSNAPDPRCFQKGSFETEFHSKILKCAVVNIIDLVDISLFRIRYDLQWMSIMVQQQVDEASISKEVKQYTYMDADQYVFMDMVCPLYSSVFGGSVPAI